MNKQRRDDLSRAATLVDDARDIVSNAAVEERDYYESMPEGIQRSEKGERADEVADELESIADELDSLYSRIMEVQE